MRSDRIGRRLGLVLAACAGIAPAFAGGPLFLSEDTHKPLHWDASRPVAVYTDLGDLCDPNGVWGCISGEQATAATAFGFAQWTAVPSSSFRAEIKGDMGAIGLGDITGANAGEIVGAWNGGGYHVMFDADSSIIRDFFGAPEGVLGISSPEFAEGEVITESWAVFTSAAVPVFYDESTDADGNVQYTRREDDGTFAAGVMTHEFGHGINLSHSQTNGHITFIGAPWNWIQWAPKQCAAPYDTTPVDQYETPEDYAAYDRWIVDTMIPATETMYPFINPQHTGQAMSTVDRPDDIAAVSNLYPEADWKRAHGSIAGRVLLKDGVTPLTGVNVVARNVDDPIGDAVTAMSGDQTQGTLGPDGRFTLNGLRPGAQYVLYVENILAGGFPTPPATLPSFQEYWNGAGESGDAAQDDPCAWQAITASAGTVVQADIAFNGIARAPTYLQLPILSASDVDNSGRVVVGTYYGQAAWRYDTVSGRFTVVDSIATPALARDGRTMTTMPWPAMPPWEGGMYEPGLWSPHKGTRLLGLPAGEPGCDGYVFSPLDLTENAGTVVGLGYRNGCPRPPRTESELGPNKFYGATWSAAGGMQYLDTPDVVLEEKAGCQWDRETGCNVLGSRANAVSGDGRTIVGHVDTGDWKGAAWVDRRFVMMGADDPKGFVGAANAVNRDGSVAVGGNAGDVGGGWGIDAYLWSLSGGTTNIGHVEKSCESYAPWLCELAPTVALPADAWAVSDRGDIVVGRAGDFWNGFAGFLWLKGLGMQDLNDFLRGQGVMEAYTTSLVGPTAMSPNGKTLIGWGYTDTDYVSFVLKLDNVWVCRGNRSKLVGFPGGLQAALKTGATAGLCTKDRPIEP